MLWRLSLLHDNLPCFIKMASSFAAQLNEIAAKSNNELDLKAQKTAHSQSLIFEKRIAAAQDFDTIYQLCLEGFEDLCKIDPRFRDYERNLFSRQSKTQERDQMTAQQNATLDTVIEACLGLLGARLLLSPAVKVAEWLVRRFRYAELRLRFIQIADFFSYRAHEYNTSFLLLTFLPYHATPIFRNLLSILPLHLPPQFKFLAPYITGLTNPPRHPIAYAATNNDGLFAVFNNYTLHVCRVGSLHQTLISFWASITAEAVAGRLDLARSGRKEIQRQRQEDVLLKILPLLIDGLSMRDSSDMVVACLTFAIILASKTQLTDKLLDGLMEAVNGALNSETMDAGLICLSILTQKKSHQSLTGRIVAKLARVNDLEKRLQALNKTYDVETFSLAVVRTVLLNSQAQDQHERIGFVERLLFAELMSPPKFIIAIGSLLTLLTTAGEDASPISVKDSAAEMLRRLTDNDKFSPLIASAMKEAGVDTNAIEVSLQAVIDEREKIPAEVYEMDLDDEPPGEAQSPLFRALQRVPQRTVDEHSFLSPSPSHLFEPLLKAFILAAQSTEGIHSFSKIPLWTSSTDLGQPLFASFFIRVFCGPYPVQVRHAALSVVGEWLSKLSDFDSQAILPYLLPQLADPTKRIREAASEVLLAIAYAFPSAIVDGETFKQWGVEDLYGSGKDEIILTFLSTKDVSKIFQRALLPTLEECILDSTQIKRVVETALGPNLTNTRAHSESPSMKLKKYLRQSFFRLLLGHLISTPLYSVKLGLLRLFANVEKVDAIHKRKELMPVLLHWACSTPEMVQKWASTEHLDITHVSSALCGIISPTENDAVESLLHLTSSAMPKRSDILTAVSERIQNIWPQMKTDRQIAAVDSLMGLMFHDQERHSDRSSIGKHLFESVDMSTDILTHLLNNVYSSMNVAWEHLPVSKKRRNNENQAVPVNKSQSEASLANIREVTFVLELVDSSKPESRAELLSGLFNILDALRQLKTQYQSDLSYLLSLPLGSLLSIVRYAALHASKIDLSAVRLDVIIDCMRTTPNAQVQNNALLLIAAVASVAPARVLDSIMPVFTFMGTNMLGKEDDYSSYVVDQIMDKVIPPLIESLHSRGQDLTVETSDLMLSFTVAYEHIPSTRRLRLFKKLITNLGDEMFLSVLISSLVQRYDDQTDVIPFIISLANTFEIDVQLKTCTDLVVLVEDALAGQSGRKATTAASEDAHHQSPTTTVSSLLRTLDEVLTKSNLRSRISRLNQSAKIETTGLMPFWQDLLDRLIRLLQTLDVDDVLSSIAKAVLSSLLSLIPTVSFIDVAKHFVDAGPDIIRRRVLRQLEERLHEQTERNSSVQGKSISFLPTLFRLLRESKDEITMHAGIACIDRICEMYGRKDVPVVVEAARIISGHTCLGSSVTDINVLALLCLSSIVELVNDAIIVIIPQMMPKIFGLLQSSLEEGSEDPKLHDASFTLLSALLARVPFIVSAEHLDQLLSLAAESRNLLPESNEIRGQCLELLGKNIQLANITASLQRIWATIVENDVSAVQQALSVLSNSVKSTSKSIVAKNADKLSSFLLQAYDLRRIQFTNRTEDSYNDSDVYEIEKTINALAMEIIYKLNDTSFRPIFLHLIDWATKCPDVKSSNVSKARKLRQTSLFNFLAHFFNTLKSIVKSYATHIIEPAIAVLNDISTTTLSSSSSSSPALTSSSKSKPHPALPPDPDSIALYLSTLTALHSSLLHHSTFSHPTLFPPLASSLTSQLHLSSNPSYAPLIPRNLIPTIVALAAAVVDNPECLKLLGSLLCALKRSAEKAVRGASVKVHLALLGAGEDWGDGGDGEGEDEDLGVALAEEWAASVLGVGEGMVYVNEMLEDEDEGVEAAVRRLVRRVRKVGGEKGEEGFF